MEPPLTHAVEDGRGFFGYVIYNEYDEPSFEIGWMRAARAWGQGCAAELTRVLLGGTQAEGKEVVIEGIPEQVATRRIADCFGFSLVGERDWPIVFRRLRLV